MVPSNDDDPGNGVLPPDHNWVRQLDATYRREAPRLSRFLRKRMRGTGDEQDIVQDAFARLAAHSHSRPLRNPEALLQRIVRNLLIDRSRLSANRAQHVPIEAGPDLAAPPDQTYAIEARDLKRRYREAVAALPPRTRQIFVMHRLDELGYGEIATSLDISTATVRWHVAQAILRIGEALDND